ncbi:MAG: hypothetical protein SFY80_12300 [Verrucomicrobiota bacterium]|nr:hypothetical protein [Verrucomicrobiota bacterium]
MKKQTAKKQTERNTRVESQREVHLARWRWLQFVQLNPHMTTICQPGYWY